MILSASNICKSYGTNVILDHISFMIEPGEKTAFVGVNGAGKTTLFKILSGQEAADSGQVIISKAASMAFLEQDTSFESQRTIYDELKSAFEDIIATEGKLRQMEKEMGVLSDSALEQHLEEYNTLLHYFEANDGYSYESLIRGVISGLGLDGADIADKKISTLSGGQKTRVALGKQLLKKPELLLLDEPTNHLDIDSISWLESYLKAYPHAVLLISHDRYFMDAVVSKVIDIERGIAAIYSGGYSDFIERKQINQDIHEKHYKDQQKEIKKQEETIRLLRSFNREKSIKRAESREKLLAKVTRIEKPQGTPANMHFALKPRIQSGYDVLTVHNLAKSYGDNRLFEHISFEVKREESIALIGPNGIGKTTILRIIMGLLDPDAGKIRQGVNVKIGYYDQERQNLDSSLTIIQQIKEIYPRMTDGEIRNVLAAFLFRGDDVYKPISALSGGERGRVCLAIIMLGGANFLILDEPTNHLDMYSKEILENALLDFQGTIFYVSHDRYFINRTATKVLELSKDGIKSYMGNYDYYVEKKADDAALAQAALENRDKTPYEKKRDELAAMPKSSWQEQKAERSAARKKQNKLEKIEADIVETEEKIKECDELLCFPEVFSDALRAKEVYDLKQSLEATLESLYDQWEIENGD